MIALVTTFFLVFYILVPGVIFRFATSFSSVKLKSFERTRTQEATFAVTVALLPFFLASLGVRLVPPMQHHPFAIQDSNDTERRNDYYRTGEMLLNSDLAKLTGCVPSSTPCPTVLQYWASFDLVLHRQARFLSWYFLFTFCEGIFFGWMAGKYGDWQRTTANKRNPLIFLYDWLTRKFILPNLSEWHVLLTGFNWPKGVLVVADVLQNDDHLYRGRVEDYFVDSDGKFSGILLRNVDRFDRYAYRKAQDLAGENSPILASDNYWKSIPSKNFYIAQGAIANLNIRFAPAQDKALEELTRQILSLEEIQGKISVRNAESREIPGPQIHPDIYS
jgi:hypothetical protein